MTELERGDVERGKKKIKLTKKEALTQGNFGRGQPAKPNLPGPPNEGEREEKAFSSSARSLRKTPYQVEIGRSWGGEPTPEETGLQIQKQGKRKKSQPASQNRPRHFWRIQKRAGVKNTGNQTRIKATGKKKGKKKLGEQEKKSSLRETFLSRQGEEYWDHQG